MVAMIPAQVMWPGSDRDQVGGTIWNGQAAAGAMRIAWHWSPIASLMRLGYSADWQITGGDTDLTGTADVAPGQVRLNDIAGLIDGNLLAAMAPSLPLSCRFLARVAIAHLTIGGNDQRASGIVRASPSHCQSPGPSATGFDLPALSGTIGPGHGGSSGFLFTMPAYHHLIEVRLSRGGTLQVWSGPAMVTHAPMLAGLRYDAQLRW